ncbi:TetR/AcrR family transcriptional regulator [Myxococcaceae bacterium GXIMD 01537]
MDALLQATADILVRDGYAKLTTNRIAARAGVNVASLYQFFPNKDALLAELARRHVAEERAAMHRVMMEQQGRGIEAMTRTLVSLGIAAHAVAPRLHHALTEVLPARRSDEWTKEDAPMLDLFRQQLARSDVPDPELALWMVNTVAHAVIHRAAVERPEALSQGVLAEELATLLLRYLRRK